MNVTKPCAVVLPPLEVEGTSKSEPLGRLKSAVPLPVPNENGLLVTESNVAWTVELEGPFTTPLSFPVSTTAGSVAH